MKNKIVTGLCLALLMSSAVAMYKKGSNVDVLEGNLKIAVQNNNSDDVSAFVKDIKEWYRKNRKAERHALPHLTRAGLTEEEARRLLAGESLDDVRGVRRPEPVVEPVRQPVREPVREPQLIERPERRLQPTRPTRPEIQEPQQPTQPRPEPVWVETDVQVAIRDANNGVMNNLAKMLHKILREKDNDALRNILKELDKSANKKAKELLKSHDIMMKVNDYLAEQEKKGQVLAIGWRTQPVQQPERPVRTTPTSTDLVIVKANEGVVTDLARDLRNAVRNSDNQTLKRILQALDNPANSRARDLVLSDEVMKAVREYLKEQEKKGEVLAIGWRTQPVQQPVQQQVPQIQQGSNRQQAVTDLFVAAYNDPRVPAPQDSMVLADYVARNWDDIYTNTILVEDLKAVLRQKGWSNDDITGLGL